MKKYAMLIAMLLAATNLYAMGGTVSPQVKCQTQEESKCPNLPKNFSAIEYANLSQETKTCMQRAADLCRCKHQANKRFGYPAGTTDTVISRYNVTACSEFGLPDAK